MASALRDVLPPTRADPCCLDIRAHRAADDGRLFYIHLRWVDEAAFEAHARLPHSVRFIDRVRMLIDHPFEVIRTRPITEIRAARPEDAAAACEVLRRSITDLCVADHHNDQEILQRWLANKTPEIVESWITNPANTMLLAVDGDVILAVGSVTDGGEITLNYVAPDARFRGVSRTMMNALEGVAKAKGLTRCTLTSSETARRFYHAVGYIEIGPPVGKFGTAARCPRR